MTDEERYDIMFYEIYDLKAENKALQEKINKMKIELKIDDSYIKEIERLQKEILKYKEKAAKYKAERDKAVLSNEK